MPLRLVPALATVVGLACGCTGLIDDPRGADGDGRTGSGAAPVRCTDDGSATLPQRVVRLANRQYANGVRDLLGLTDAPVLTNGGDRDDTFFAGGTDRVTDPLAFEYDLVATSAAAAADVEALLACDAGEDELGCARAFVERFAARAFRRPLGADERDRLFSVLDVGQTQDGTVADGVRLVIRAVLQAPSFIYRTEIGAPAERAGEVALTPHEIATELALLFLDSPVPDDALFRAAEAGELSTEEGILAQVDRLMAEPDVQAHIADVLMRWVGANQLAEKDKAAAEFTEALRASMLEESRVFFERQVFGENATLADLFTTRTTWADSTLADFYGVPYPGPAGGDEPLAVTLPDERMGMLTQPALLAALSDRDRTSVVHRGLFVARGLLCQEYAPPPPGAADDPERTGDTERERAEYRMSTAPCSNCHTGFDPFGVVFEQYDEIGRFHPDIDGSYAVSQPPSVAGPTDGVVELASRLAEAPELLGCTARRMASYSLGRPLASDELCNIDLVERRFVESGGDVRELFRAVAVSHVVRTRVRGGVAP